MSYKILTSILPIEICGIVFDYNYIDELVETYLKRYIVNLALCHINYIKDDIETYYDPNDEDDREEIEKYYKKIIKFKKMNNYDICHETCPDIDYIDKLYDMKIIKYNIDAVFDVLLTERIIKR